MGVTSGDGGRRLDAPLWNATRLGVACPTGLLTEYVQRGADFVYCAFRERDRTGLEDLKGAIEALYAWAGMPQYHGYSEAAASWLRVVDDVDELRRYRRIEGLAPHSREYVGVLAVPHGADEPVGFAIAHPWQRDPRLAFGDYLWVGPRRESGLDEDQYRTVQIGLWLRLVDTLVKRGFVALTGIMDIHKVRKVAVGSDAPFPIFRALGDELAAVGLLSRYEDEGRIPLVANFTMRIAEDVEQFQLQLLDDDDGVAREEALVRIRSALESYRSRRIARGDTPTSRREALGSGRLTLNGQILLDGLVTWAESWEVPASSRSDEAAVQRFGRRLGAVIEHVNRQLVAAEA